MDLAEAVERLQSGSQRERLEAARVLAMSATDRELTPLHNALRLERLPWIRSALEAGVARASVPGTSPPEQPEPLPLTTDEELASEVYGRAVEDLTYRFVHEIRPILGRARLWASREIATYETSQTAAALDQMRDVLGAVYTLGQAAGAPKVAPFDLAELVREIVENCDAEIAQQRSGHRATQLEGPEPFVTATDRDLLALAVRNGVRNAIEASLDVNEPVVVSWGQSSAELWVAVLDAGNGLNIESAEAMAPGKSTKTDHLGMGLAIAEQAMKSLAGSIVLESTGDGFTRFAVTCPRGGTG
jgi:signal transduction histidine kinase